MGPQNPRLRADPAGGGVCISDPAESFVRGDIASSLNAGMSVSSTNPRKHVPHCRFFIFASSPAILDPHRTGPTPKITEFAGPPPLPPLPALTALCRDPTAHWNDRAE